MKNWDDYFIELAGQVATKSKDPSTQVGCVIVGPDNEIRSTGFNGFPRGVKEMQAKDPHVVVAFERMFIAGPDQYAAKCFCGEVIPFTMMSTQEEIHVSDLRVSHPHFQQPLGELHLHPERWERPAKYEWVEHAERNAVYNAARMGVSTKGCRAYLNWEPRPCIECCKGFIQAGIIEVIGPNIPFPSGGTRKDWKFEVSTIMMGEAKMKCREVEYATEDTS